jgi:hypothetical protein
LWRGSGPSASHYARPVSHFDDVGFAVYREAEAKELISSAIEVAVARGDVVEDENGVTTTYRDPSGARLTVYDDRGGGLPCVAVGFEGDHRVRWRPLGVVRVGGDCRACDLVYAELLEDEDEMILPFALSVETMGVERALIPYGEAAEVRFAGLWEEGVVWPDEEAFRETQEAEWAHVEVPEPLRGEIPALRGWAVRSLIPSGTFGQPMTPHVIAYGIVESTEERQNELGGGAFEVVRLDTLGGVVEACLPAGSESFSPGKIVQATLWLVGRPLTLRDESGPVPEMEPPRGQKRSRLRRLFRSR